MKLIQRDIRAGNHPALIKGGYIDTRQVEYILKIAEENNTTHAATELFITQSALNQQLIKLENELGTPLFHRSRTNWHLTEADEICIRDAKEIIRLRRETYQTTHDPSDGRCGYLAVGFTAGRGINMLTRVYGTFHQFYPNVIIEPVKGIVKQLQELISMGDLDLTFLTLTDEDRSDDLYEPVYDEELSLVVPARHPLAGTRPEEGEDRTTMNIRRLEYEPFVLIDRRSTMSTVLNHIFAGAGFSPQVLFKTGNNHTIISMIQTNMCCGILPYYYIRDLNQDFCCFHLPSRPTWQFTASYKKGHYLSRPARSFIDLIKERQGNKITATR